MSRTFRGKSQFKGKKYQKRNSDFDFEDVKKVSKKRIDRFSRKSDDFDDTWGGK